MSIIIKEIEEKDYSQIVNLYNKYFTNQIEIQDRIKEREQTKSKEALIIFGVVFAGMAILLGLVYYLI